MSRVSVVSLYPLQTPVPLGIGDRIRNTTNGCEYIICLDYGGNGDKVNGINLATGSRLLGQGVKVDSPRKLTSAEVTSLVGAHAEMKAWDVIGRAPYRDPVP